MDEENLFKTNVEYDIDIEKISIDNITMDNDEFIKQKKPFREELIISKKYIKVIEDKEV